MLYLQQNVCYEGTHSFKENYQIELGLFRKY